MTLPEFDLVIFDLDGTVADTLGPTFRCFQAAVAPALGRTPSVEEILERFGPADHRIVADWVGEEAAAAAVERLYACYRTAFEGARPFTGMKELLEDLRARGLRTALFTGRGRPSTDVLLDSLGIRGLFDAGVTGEEVPRPKPAPDGIEAILERLGIDRERAVHVGDTVKDADAAAAAGVRPVAALWGSPEPGRLEALPVPRAKTVAELRELLLGGSL